MTPHFAGMQSVTHWAAGELMAKAGPILPALVSSPPPPSPGTSDSESHNLSRSSVLSLLPSHLYSLNHELIDLISRDHDHDFVNLSTKVVDVHSSTVRMCSLPKRKGKKKEKKEKKKSKTEKEGGAPMAEFLWCFFSPPPNGFTRVRSSLIKTISTRLRFRADSFFSYITYSFLTCDVFYKNQSHLWIRCNWFSLVSSESPCQLTGWMVVSVRATCEQPVEAINELAERK